MVGARLLAARGAAPVARVLLAAALVLAGLTLVGCGGKPDEADVAMGPIEACIPSRKDGKRLLGAYLRRVEAAQGYEMFSVTGKARSSGLPRNLAFDDRKIRRLRGGGDGPLTGSRRSTVTPHPGFAATGTLPAVYELSYRAEKIDYTGALVVGNSAAGFEIPTTGRMVHSGRIALTLSLFDAAGGAAVATAEGRFTASIGFGSGRSTFTVDALQVTSGAALPFATLTWGPLGLCGARVVSSGQGAIKLVAEDGRKVSPFLTGRAPTPLRSSFEAAQFAADDRPGPPGRFGGVFLIESDEGTISAVFLSDGSP